MTILLCEGVGDSPDERVLNKLLSAYCQVEPIGSKHAMETLVRARRQVSPRDTVMGLKDGDFDRDWRAPSDHPRPWTRTAGGKEERIGWSWARKEIETYLIDPEGVARAPGTKASPRDRYQEILERAAGAISDYIGPDRAQPPPPDGPGTCDSVGTAPGR